jgi:hypothetical protein
VSLKMFRYVDKFDEKAGNEPVVCYLSVSAIIAAVHAPARDWMCVQLPGRSVELLGDDCRRLREVLERATTAAAESERVIAWFDADYSRPEILSGKTVRVLVALEQGGTTLAIFDADGRWRNLAQYELVGVRFWAPLPDHPQASG